MKKQQKTGEATNLLIPVIFLSLKTQSTMKTAWNRQA